jgi:hypothetical protein
MKERMKPIGTTVPANYKKQLKIIAEREKKSQYEILRDIYIQYIDWNVSQYGMEV